jgi:hypothetical protein
METFWVTDYEDWFSFNGAGASVGARVKGKWERIYLLA